jgi:signal transduction histidine kinase
MNGRLSWTRRKDRSLLAQTLLANFVPVAVLGVGMFALCITLFVSYLQNVIVLRQYSAEGLARLLAQQCAAPALMGDHGELERIAGTMLQVENVLYVSVFPTGGTPEVHVSRLRRNEAGNDGARQTQPNRGLAALATIRVVEAVARIPLGVGRDVVDWAPGGAIPADLGRVRVVLSTEEEERLSRGALWNGVAVSLVLLVLIWLVQQRRMRSVLAPLKNLAEVTRKLAAGDLKQRAEIVRADEVGELARAFNEMAEELEIAQEHGRKALAAAQESSRLKSQFLANMSHEIRTPMNGIIGMTQLALETNLTVEQREYLEATMTSAGSLLGLLNDFLDLSRIEAGKLHLEESSFDLCQVAAECLRAVGPPARQKGIALSFETRPGVPRMVLGDEVRLRQILDKLLSNAIRFTNAGRVSVELSLERRTAGAALVKFTVSDTGIGIPAGKQRWVFEAFSQVDGSHTRTHGGCGLGLAICSRLVALMHGTIWMESEMDHGSRFHFTAEFKLQSEAGKPPRGQDARVAVPKVTGD